MTIDLSRFRAAQDRRGTFARALGEIRVGVKRTHWMWFIFPQAGGLGATSEMSRYFAIRSRAEAVAYLADPVLSRRLAQCTAGVLRQRTLMFNEVDTAKLRSSMTLFGQLAEDPTMLDAVIAKFFDGPDQRTLDVMRRADAARV